MNVPELRMPVAQLPDLVLIQSLHTMIALAHIALPVLPFAVKDAASREDQDTDLAAKIDRVTSIVLWCVRQDICPAYLLATEDSDQLSQTQGLPCGNNASSSAQGDNVCRRQRSKRWIACVVGCPGEERRTAWKGTQCDEKNATVSQIGISSPSHDCEACDSREGEDCEIDTTTVRLV